MQFDLRGLGNKSTRDSTVIKLLKSPAIMVSGFSTIFLPSSLNKNCDRLKLLIQEIQARNTSDIINNEMFAIFDKLLEHKCMSKKQHKQI